MTLHEHVKQRLTRDDFAYSDEFLDAVVGVVLGVVADEIKALPAPAADLGGHWYLGRDAVLAVVERLGER